MACAQKLIELASIQPHHGIAKEITVRHERGDGQKWEPSLLLINQGGTKVWRAVIAASWWIYSYKPVNKGRTLVLKTAPEIHSLYKLSPQATVSELTLPSPSKCSHYFFHSLWPNSWQEATYGRNVYFVSQLSEVQSIMAGKAYTARNMSVRM